VGRCQNDPVDSRLDRYDAVSTRLAALSDRELLGCLPPVTAGFGGATGSMTVAGVPVFAKIVPLTDRERRHDGSTANLFALPTFYQYGVGSAGFGAWREIATHEMTTRWVLDGAYDGFPLLYHRRVVPWAPNPMPAPEVDRWVAHWDGSGAVRSRLEAIGRASAAVVLFLEHIPQTMDSWLAGSDAYLRVERDLRAGTAFLRSRGLIHFDAHFRNLLTDGERLYFADFGLALHSDFDLTAEERQFFDRHRDYDRAYTAAFLPRWLVHHLLGVPWWEVPAFLRGNSAGGLSPAAAGILARHRPVAVVFADFFEALEKVSKATPYPVEKLSALEPGGL
jgi:hypothetical protein